MHMLFMQHSILKLVCESNIKSSSASRYNNIKTNWCEFHCSGLGEFQQPAAHKANSASNTCQFFRSPLYCHSARDEASGGMCAEAHGGNNENLIISRPGTLRAAALKYEMSAASLRSRPAAASWFSPAAAKAARSAHSRLTRWDLFMSLDCCIRFEIKSGFRLYVSDLGTEQVHQEIARAAGKCGASFSGQFHAQRLLYIICINIQFNANQHAANHQLLPIVVYPLYETYTLIFGIWK